MGDFLPFLPQDEGLTAPPEISASISRELGRLLSLDAPGFWDVVLNDASLPVCIDTYLRFKRRAHDAGNQEEAGVPPADATLLARRVFMVLLRIVSSGERPGPATRGVPSAAERAQWLFESRLLDAPKLLDVAALYGRANPQLASRLIASTLALQPLFRDQLQALVEPLAANLSALTAHGAPTSAAGLLDLLAYLKDVCVTLGAFVGCYPPAAGLLMDPGQGQLLGALAGVHDGLLPALSRSTAGQDNSRAAVAEVAGMLQLLAAQLVTAAYVSAPAESDSSGVGASGSGSGSSGAASSSAPAGGSNAAAAAATAAVGSSEPERRGMGLMSAVMCAAHADGAAGAGGSMHGPGAANLMHAINRRYDLGGLVAVAMREGRLLLDDAQVDYLLALLGGPVEAAGPRPGSAGGDAPPAANGLGGGGTAPAAPEPAVMASLISQVRDVMGDGLGEGYVTACLHAYSYNAEQVLHHLLEGSLKPELQGLDPGLAAWKPPSSPVVPTPPSQGADPGTWQALRAGADAAARASGATASGARPLAVPTQRKPQAMHRGVARVLGALDEGAKAATRRLADSLQVVEVEEYDDEYDDSFDDLAQHGADGVADVEGDGDAPAPVIARDGGAEDEADGGSSSSSAPARGNGPFGAGGRGGRGARGGRGIPGRGGAAPLFAPPPQGDGAGPSGGRGGSGGRDGGRWSRGTQRPSRLWVHDGKIYNYAKEGAREVGSQEEAQATIRTTAQEVYGLGAGGNKGINHSRWEAIQSAGRGRPAAAVPGSAAPLAGGGRATAGDQPQGEGGGEGREVGAAVPGGEGDGAPGRGRGGRGRGGPPNYARKEQNKAAVGNHHRKDRAYKKMGMM